MILLLYSQFCRDFYQLVLHPIHKLGKVIKAFNQDIYFVVDGVSCIGAVDVDLERDNIDVLVSGSQKAFVYRLAYLFVVIIIVHKSDLKQLKHHVLFKFK